MEQLQINLLFEEVQYQGIYDLDKSFTVKSEKAYILDDKPDLVYMTNMHVVLYLTDGRIVNILSDKGKYNKKAQEESISVLKIFGARISVKGRVLIKE